MCVQPKVSNFSQMPPLVHADIVRYRNTAAYPSTSTHINAGELSKYMFMFMYMY